MKSLGLLLCASTVAAACARDTKPVASGYIPHVRELTVTTVRTHAPTISVFGLQPRGT